MLNGLTVLCNTRLPGADLLREFPSVHVGLGPPVEPHLRASDWERRDFDTWVFDCRLDELARGPFTLCLHDDSDRPGFALEVMTRCQRHVDRRNQYSHGLRFTRLLARHRSLHDLEKPLVHADYNHALDVWQWLLRLDPSAPLPLQLAALFHDVERLHSEADARVEQHAADYQQFKDAHARKGAEITAALLLAAGFDDDVCAEVTALIAGHERQDGLLSDADALSFFSLNSPGYADYFGEEQTRRKVAYTWNRMSDRARRRLDAVHLRQDVRAMVDGLSS